MINVHTMFSCVIVYMCTMIHISQVAGLTDDKGCLTDGFYLDGGEGWSPTLFIRLIQDYGFDIDVCI